VRRIPEDVRAEAEKCDTHADEPDARTQPEDHLEGLHGGQHGADAGRRCDEVGILGAQRTS
jgi:hypothetical protein